MIVWDGGNNDPAFYAADLTLVVADPLRAGHELKYWAGETNLTMADVVVINKCDSATKEQIRAVEESVASRNPDATVIRADSILSVDDESLIKGKRVLAVEDGPTLTHGEMDVGAAYVVSQRLGATEIVDPRPSAVGSIEEAFKNYPRLAKVVPALGYYDDQLADLKATIDGAECDSVVIGTPIDLRRVIEFSKPATRVRYDLKESDTDALVNAIARAIER